MQTVSRFAGFFPRQGIVRPAVVGGALSAVDRYGRAAAAGGTGGKPVRLREEIVLDRRSRAQPGVSRAPSAMGGDPVLKKAVVRGIVAA